MNELSWEATKRLVYERAAGCCEYCRTCEAIIGQAMHIEHIDPKGGDMLDNLCLSCPNCNLSKATAITAIDPVSRAAVALYHPRLQSWSAHFRWSGDSTMITGLTATGRATVERLKMNRLRIVKARAQWAKAHLHPPTD